MDLRAYVSRIAQAKWLPWLLLAVGIIVVVACVLWLGWVSALLASSWFWVAAVLFLAAIVAVTIRWGLPWLEQQRFLRQPAIESLVAGEASPEEFNAKFSSALAALRALPRMAALPDPFHALPWYLVLGKAGTGKTTLFRDLGIFSSLAAPAPAAAAETQNFDWWVSNELVAIDTAGRYSFPVELSRDRGEWYRLLRLLRQARNRAPISGIVVAISSEDLICRRDDELRSEASKLRERVEEATKELGVDVPVYLIVTKCDLIEGFTNFVSQLPEATHKEAFGYIDDCHDAAQRGRASLDRLRSGLVVVTERLRHLRLGILDGDVTNELRPEIFCFPEELRSLTEPLVALCEPLFSDDVRFRTPRLRGVFFTSSLQDSTSLSRLRMELGLPEASGPRCQGHLPYFLHDLFSIVLPRDRGLTATTDRESRRRLIGRSVRATLLSAFALAIALLPIREYLADQEIQRSTDASRCDTSPQNSAATLSSIDSCRKVIESLVDKNRSRNRVFPIGFRQSFRLEEDLRARFVARFRADVLNPSNDDVGRALASARDSLPILVLLAKRIQLQRECASGAGCANPVGQAPREYALLASPTKEQTSSVADQQLADAFAAYLRWQPVGAGVRQEELTADEKRLKSALVGSPLSLDRLVPLVNRRHSPLTLQTYWELPDPITEASQVRIDAAYTVPIFESEIKPLLQQIQDAVPDLTPELQTFGRSYRKAAIEQWGGFLAAFPSGAERWKGRQQRAQLAWTLLGDRSPTLRVLTDTSRMLKTVLGSDDGGDQLPAWVLEVRQWEDSDRERTFTADLTSIAQQLGGAVNPAESLGLARQTFEAATKTENGANPLLAAEALATAAPVKSNSVSTGAEPAPGRLLEKTVAIVWRAILYAAATELQRIWTETVATPVRRLPAAEQLISLHEPGGRLSSFVSGPLSPFLDADKSRPLKLMGEALPLSPAFLALLGDARQIGMILSGDGPPHPIRIKLGHTALDGGASLVEEKTSVTVACTGNTIRLSSPGQNFGIVPWSYQECTDANLSVVFVNRAPSEGRADRYALTRRYPGRTGFISFINDFASGPKQFTLEEFAGADPAAGDLINDGLRALKISVQVETPAALASLLTQLQSPLVTDILPPLES